MRYDLMAALLGLGLVTMAATADASSVNASTISQIDINGTQFALIRMTNTVGGTRPACHVGGLQQTAFSLDLNTTKGRAVLALATAIQLAGRKANITGSGSCLTTGYGAMESVGTFQSDL